MSSEAARVAYRVRQFRNGLLPRFDEQDRQAVARQLSPAEQALFWSMNGYGRRHSLDVYRRLVGTGCRDSAILTAALLHDVGKGRISLAHRVAVVLIGRFWPALLRRLAAAPGPAWRHGFYLDARHAAIGAALAEQAGAGHPVVDLIRRHQEKDPADRRLALLRAADDDQ
ncbi:MAG: HD domain-containing protein [Chloroflexi bacterium]|nr:HD domain-containing protein [Chloroflexota bacterium]